MKQISFETLQSYKLFLRMISFELPMYLSEQFFNDAYYVFDKTGLSLLVLVQYLQTLR